MEKLLKDLIVGDIFYIIHNMDVEIHTNKILKIEQGPGSNRTIYFEDEKGHWNHFCLEPNRSGEDRRTSVQWGRDIIFSSLQGVEKQAHDTANKNYNQLKEVTESKQNKIYEYQREISILEICIKDDESQLNKYKEVMKKYEPKNNIA